MRFKKDVRVTISKKDYEFFKTNKDKVISHSLNNKSRNTSVKQPVNNISLNFKDIN